MKCLRSPGRRFQNEALFERKQEIRKIPELVVKTRAVFTSRFAELLWVRKASRQRGKNSYKKGIMEP